MVDKQAFSIVNKAIHFGVNFGVISALSFPSLDFISLQLTRTSWTLSIIAAEVESVPLLVSCKISTFLRNAISLELIVDALSLLTACVSGFNNLIKKGMQLGESKRCSSWPYRNLITIPGKNKRCRSIKEADEQKYTKVHSRVFAEVEKEISSWHMHSCRNC